MWAQSITVAPKTAYAVTGGTSQFTASVTGLSGTGVTWSAGGKVGGNSTAGSINSTGLYTAPAKLPGQNPVQIKATSTADGKTAGIAYVNILSAGPTITSVSPNPLPVGTFTVTITGSGFVPGAEAYDSFGSYSGIQLVTLSLTATSLTATGYQGPAASASFAVKNPGSVVGNSISVPVVGNSGGGGGSGGSGRRRFGRRWERQSPADRLPFLRHGRTRGNATVHRDQRYELVGNRGNHHRGGPLYGAHEYAHFEFCDHHGHWRGRIGNGDGYPHQ